MVAREPGHRARRLTERDRSVVRPQPAFAPPVVMGDRLRRARVVHDAAEGGALPEVIAQLQGQLLPVPPNPRLAAVDGGAQHLHAEEVEIEGAEVLGGLRCDLRSALEAAVARVVGQSQGVVGDVVAAVAELREVRVTGACGSGVPAPEHRAGSPLRAVSAPVRAPATPPPRPSDSEHAGSAASRPATAKAARRPEIFTQPIMTQPPGAPDPATPCV